MTDCTWAVGHDGWSNPEVGALVPMLGRHISTSSLKAQDQLGWRPRSATDTVLDTGRHLTA